MDYSKIELARIQLERAGESSAIDDLKGWLSDNHPDSEIHDDFYKISNATRNGVKHFSNPDESTVFLAKEEALYWLLRANMNYTRCTSSVTKPMHRLITWWKQENT